MIDTDERLARLLPRLQAAEWIAFDTEADSLHAYPEKICLMQISFPGADEVIDPLASVDLAPLWEALRGRRLFLHGADYDLRLLQKHHGFAPHAVFDTMIAARLLGIERFGLSDLAMQLLGVTLEKGPQKANWALRPLTERMADYARNDTRHLQALATRLEDQLRAKGRWQWCEETCARLVEECAKPNPPDPDAVWRLSGSGRMSRAELAILRELFFWREEQAIAANRPPFFILSHDALLAIAAAAARHASVEPLLPRRFSPQRHAGLLQAVARGCAVPPAERPEHVRRAVYHPSLTERRRFDELKHRRDGRAAELQLDPALIASRATLEALSRDGSKAANELMLWQREVMEL